MKSTLKVIFVVSSVSFFLTLLWWSQSSSVIRIQEAQSLQFSTVNSKLFTNNVPQPELTEPSVDCSRDEVPSKHVRDINSARSFLHALNQTVNVDNNVILSVVDYGVREFAVNFYISSIQKLGFRNHLFLCTDEASQVYLSRCNIPCYIYHVPFQSRHIIDSKKNSPDFGSYNYQLKTNLKTRVVLDALIYGFNVLISDVDIVMLKDPFSYFSCSTCDVHITLDRVHYNSGFVYVRSTLMSVKLYKLAWEYYQHYHKSHDQAYLNMAVLEMKNNDSDLALYELPSTRFPCGHYYFRSDFRMFNNSKPCKNCVIIHNNYIGSAAAKEYRFKENLLWYVDSKNYYSNPHEKFITYKNPLDFGQRTFEFETQALKNAMMIGAALDRKVILPTFHCCNCKLKKCDHPKHKCSLLSLLKLNIFDKEYHGKYREHVFLWNNMVPDIIRRSKILRIHLNLTQQNYNIPVSDEIKILNKDALTPNTRQTILDGLKSYEDVSVLEFSALYGDFEFVLRPAEKLYYRQHSEEIFMCSDYDQWDVPEHFTETKLPKKVKDVYHEKVKGRIRNTLSNPFIYKNEGKGRNAQSGYKAFGKYKSAVGMHKTPKNKTI